MCVGYELEYEIGDVYTKQEYSRATGNDQKTLLSILIQVRNQGIGQCY